jgi:hypothetical protein
MVVEATTQLGEHFSVRQWGGDDGRASDDDRRDDRHCRKSLFLQRNNAGDGGDDRSAPFPGHHATALSRVAVGRQLKVQPLPRTARSKRPESVRTDHAPN